jgi:Rne/Rng family ribonuclease
MSRRVVVERGALSMAAALMDGPRLVDLEVVDLRQPPVTDTLFAARVERVDPQLNAAFLDLGEAGSAFLGARDARPVTGTAERLPISRLVREGQKLLVQGLREPIGDKGPRVTADIKLFGFFVILRPFAGTPEIPGRLPARDADAMRERAERLFSGRGVVLRRSATTVEDSVLLAEAAMLGERWVRLRAEADGQRRPGRLPADEPVLERLLRRFLDDRYGRVAAADPSVLAELAGPLRARLEAAGVEVERLDTGRPAFVQTGVDEEIERALATEVAIPGGGTLRIEETAACVAIDVDGGGRSPLDIDLAAIAEIARQLRLRNLGGTIVIDFVDLPGRQQRQRVEDALRRALRQDPVGVQQYPLSPLGIVQLSRSRRGASLAARLCRPCPSCAGTGRAPSLTRVAEALLRDLAIPPAPPAIAVAADLAAYLRGAAAPAWDALPARPRLQEDAALPSGTWRRCS